MYWFRPRNLGSGGFALDRFPSFIWKRPDGQGLWGHGSDEGFGVKVVAAGPRAERR